MSSRISNHISSSALTETRQTTKSDTQVKQPEQGKLHIVLVEDEPTLLHLYQMALDPLGQVDSVNNKLDALELLNSLQQADTLPDIILLDLIIPHSKTEVINFVDRPGFEVLEHIRATAGLKDIPVMVMTNLDSTEDREQARALQALHYIVKSNVVPREIVKRIREATS